VAKAALAIKRNDANHALNRLPPEKVIETQSLKGSNEAHQCHHDQNDAIKTKPFSDAIKMAYPAENQIRASIHDQACWPRSIQPNRFPRSKVAGAQ
jgi:hypothetical protein